MADGKNIGTLTSKGFFGFENLEVYHLSLQLAAQIYAVTRHFPADERFGLTNQLRRAATSVTLNIAEGRGRGTDKDFARFLMQARGSLYETISGLHLAVTLDYVKAEEVRDINDQAQVIASKLTAFAQKLTQ